MRWARCARGGVEGGDEDVVGGARRARGAEQALGRAARRGATGRGRATRGGRGGVEGCGRWMRSIDAWGERARGSRVDAIDRVSDDSDD